MEGTIYSIIPALLMLVLVLFTRKVVPSLGIGIIVGALFIHDFDIIASCKEVIYVFVTIFVEDGEWVWDNILLIGFLLLLGIMTALLQSSGGSRAFGEWMMKRVKTRTGAQLMTTVLGMIIFIDDYFNSLAVGQIARPLTDRYQVSRAKLSYYIDSTSAPATVISPISSWGAYIIGILGSIFAANHITNVQPFEAFIKLIPLNLYALASIVLVFIVTTGKFDIGPMKRHEHKAMTQNQLFSSNKSVPGDLSGSFTAHKDGKVFHLLGPILVLLVGCILSMVVTGWKEAGEPSILKIFANTDVNASLFVGGLLAVIVSVIFHFGQKQPRAKLLSIFGKGIQTMLPAIYILILAWMIGSIVGTLNTGEYLASIVADANVNSNFLPILFFLIACLMSLATGTSWGTFGIMLPIAAEVILNTDSTLLLPALAAVLSGSVFGDHCSPISDTTILSSTGAGVNYIDHVVTQLPYAFIAATTAGMGFLVMGFVGNYIGMMITLLLLMAIVFGNRVIFKKNRVTS